MVPKSPNVRPLHAGAARPHTLQRLHPHLTGLSLAGLLTLGSVSGGLVQSAVTKTTSPATGHAEVIAQTVADLSDDSLAWTVAAIDARKGSTDVAVTGNPGFVLGTEGAVTVRDDDGVRARLAGAKPWRCGRMTS